MREILFIAKRIIDNHWVYGGIAIRPDETVIIITKEEQIAWNVIPETVGQFTGLTDKNGVKIFEGDIVIYSGKNSLCSFIKGSFVFGNEFDLAYGYEVEVIGNIHDNPELLK